MNGFKDKIENNMALFHKLFKTTSKSSKIVSAKGQFSLPPLPSNSTEAYIVIWKIKSLKYFIGKGWFSIMLFGKGEAKDKDFQRNKSQKSFDVIGYIYL